MKPDDVVAWGLGVYQDAINEGRERLEHREGCPAWQAGEPRQCETCERELEDEGNPEPEHDGTLNPFGLEDT